MTAYISIETTQEAIAEEEELIVAVEAFVDAMSISLWTQIKNNFNELQKECMDLIYEYFPVLIEYTKGTRSLIIDMERLLFFMMLTTIAVIVFSPSVSLFWSMQRGKLLLRRLYYIIFTKKRREKHDKNETITTQQRQEYFSYLDRRQITQLQRMESRQALFHEQRLGYYSDSENNYNDAGTGSPYNTVWFTGITSQNLETSTTGKRFYSENNPTVITTRLYDWDVNTETEEERYQRNWPAFCNKLSSSQKYRKLLLPPTCRRIVVSSSATTPAQHSTTTNPSKSKGKSTTIMINSLPPPPSNSDKREKVNNNNNNNNIAATEELYEDNPALRLQHYMLQLWIFIRSILSFDYTYAVSMVFSWIQSFRRLQEYIRKGDIEHMNENQEQGDNNNSNVHNNNNNNTISCKSDESIERESSSSVTSNVSSFGKKSPVEGQRVSRDYSLVVENSQDSINDDDENDSTDQHIRQKQHKLHVSDKTQVPFSCDTTLPSNASDKTVANGSYTMIPYEATNGHISRHSLNSLNEQEQDHPYQQGTGIFKPIDGGNDIIVRRKSKVSIQTLDTGRLRYADDTLNNSFESHSVWEDIIQYNSQERNEIDKVASVPLGDLPKIQTNEIPITKQKIFTSEIDDAVSFGIERDDGTIGIPYRRNSRSDSTQQSMNHYFDTVDSHESLQQLVVDSLVPDKHGYILSETLLIDSRHDTPLLVFVNSRSGPQQGHILIAQFRRLLNPVQVWDLNDGGPEAILESFSVFTRLRLLVCGGDGTVAWIISALEKLDVYNKNRPNGTNSKNQSTSIQGQPRISQLDTSLSNSRSRLSRRQWPPIAILPLGTGNDLARIHGWGGGYNNESLITILEQISESYASLLDRWELTITDAKSKKKEKKTFFNYLGVGADAQAALQVHYLRESRPEWFFSRLVNKAMYGLFGAEDIIKASNVHTRKHLKLIADGVEIPLPPDSQGIILLNIDAYAGGVPLWSHGTKSKKFAADTVRNNICRIPLRRRRSFNDTPSSRRLLSPSSTTARGRDSFDDSRVLLSMEERFAQVTGCDLPSSCQDGILDVVSIRGAFHLGQIKVGLSNAQRLCQCREATIIITNKVAVQVDGEPWRQPNCTLTIKRKRDHAVMLHRSADDGGVEMEMSRLLDWAEERKMIDSQVHTILMKEFSRRIESKKRQMRVRGNGNNIMSTLKKAISSGAMDNDFHVPTQGSWHGNGMTF